ncbi:MAG: DUF1385 domain-containing protein [Bacillota bacterium]
MHVLGKEGFTYGGQAVIEGVMMRGRRSIAIAVRKPDSSIVVQNKPIKMLAERYPILGLPVIRGVFAFIETLIIGFDALMFSADQAGATEEEQLKPWELTVTVIVAFALFVGLFIVLPNVVAVWVQKTVHNRVLVNLAEGVFRIALFIAYIVAVSRINDIQRVFQYHGAEHKVIHTFEAGEQLSVENARCHTILHPRCGTAFLLIVMVTMVLIFSVFLRATNLSMRILTRLALLPIVTGISYEVIKLAGRPNPPKFIQWIIAPGLWLQKLTCKEPDDDQIEVAIRALTNVLEADGA